MKSPTVSMIALLGSLAACAAAPQKNASLDQAHRAVAQAQQDPQVAQKAPIELRRAEATLQQADQRWQKRSNDQDVDHLAYMATQQAAIAREAAAGRQAEDVMRQAANERTEVVRTTRARQMEQMTVAQGGANVMMSGVLFDSGQAGLKPGAERRLEELAMLLKDRPDQTVEVEGFTDQVGGEQYNRELSERRAQAVRDALARNGVDPSRIRIKGMGESYPVASNDTPAGRQQNRRVEIFMLSSSGQPANQGAAGRPGEPGSEAQPGTAGRPGEAGGESPPPAAQSPGDMGSQASPDTSGSQQQREEGAGSTE